MVQVPATCRLTRESSARDAVPYDHSLSSQEPVSQKTFRPLGFTDIRMTDSSHLLGRANVDHSELATLLNQQRGDLGRHFIRIGVLEERSACAMLSSREQVGERRMNGLETCHFRVRGSWYQTKHTCASTLVRLRQQARSWPADRSE